MMILPSLRIAEITNNNVGGDMGSSQDAENAQGGRT
jgi:hypothetical protein